MVKDSVYFETPDNETQPTETQPLPVSSRTCLDLTNTAIQSLTELQPYKFEDLILLNFAQKHPAEHCRISVAN